MPSDVSKCGLIIFGYLNSKDEGATIFSKRREGLRAISRAVIQYDHSSPKVLMQCREFLISGSVLILAIDQLNAQSFVF